MELTVDPADFTRLVEHHVLAVDGEFSEDLRTRTRQLMQAKGVPQGTEWTGLSPVTDAPLNPPADLLALVGKACETCGGDGYTGMGPWCLRPRCSTCHGTGSELLTVVTECWAEFRQLMTPRGYEGVYAWFQGDERLCDHEHDEDEDRICEEARTGKRFPPPVRSLLVRLTGQPVPVVEYVDDEPGSIDVIEAMGLNGPSRWAAGNDFAPVNDNIDLGPDPTALIGRWVWLPDALEVVE